MNKPITIAIGTTSTDKISGTIEAFSRIFGDQKEYDFCYMKVSSGVHEQPIGDETYIGAKNRVNALKEKVPNMQFYIACEAGLLTQYGQCMNVHVVCIFDAESEMYFYGMSAGVTLPFEDIEMIREKNLDTYLKEKGIRCLQDLVGKTRKDEVKTATERALCAMKFKKQQMRQ